MFTATVFERPELDHQKYIDIPAGRVRSLDRYGYILSDKLGSFIQLQGGDRLYLLNESKFIPQKF